MPIPAGVADVSMVTVMAATYPFEGSPGVVSVSVITLPAPFCPEYTKSAVSGVRDAPFDV